MSVVEKLTKLFSRKPEDSQTEISGDLSLATPDGSLDPMATGSMETQQHEADSEAQPMMAADADSVGDESLQEAAALEEADLISLPILGRRSVVIHQRVLGTL